MIIVYPMLVSQNVNASTLPGICKVLERFLIIYGLDTIASRFSLGKKAIIGTQTAMTAAPLVGLSLKRKNEQKSLYEQGGTKNEDEINKGRKSQQPLSYLRPTMDIDYPINESLSLEPTYVSVSTTTGTKILGIKVIPLLVNSSEDLGKMLMTDMALKTIDKFMYKNHVF